MPSVIDTDRFSDTLRQRSIDVSERKLLITNFRGSEQEQDLTIPANCNGYGRIRHFHRATSENWPSNPLPIDPASKALGVSPVDLLQAQVFQNSSCNWRCWYCYVPFSLLSANADHSSWLTVSELVDLYLDQPEPPRVIDLSGGQPDLIPEWIPWMMMELRTRRLNESIYLWSDDNLSNDYFFKYLSKSEQELAVSYRNYGKVCCFKGFDPESFAFNTGASPELFSRQFDIMQRYIRLGLNVFGYVTFTTPNGDDIQVKIRSFVEALQAIAPNLPLRIVPLEISAYTPSMSRIEESHRRAMQYQQKAVEAWNKEVYRRFNEEERRANIADIPLQY